MFEAGISIISDFRAVVCIGFLVVCGCFGFVILGCFWGVGLLLVTCFEGVIFILF